MRKLTLSLNIVAGVSLISIGILNYINLKGNETVGFIMIVSGLMFLATGILRLFSGR